MFNLQRQGCSLTLFEGFTRPVEGIWTDVSAVIYCPVGSLWAELLAFHLVSQSSSWFLLSLRSEGSSSRGRASLSGGEAAVSG